MVLVASQGPNQSQMVPQELAMQVPWPALAVKVGEKTGRFLAHLGENRDSKQYFFRNNPHSENGNQAVRFIFAVLRESLL